MADREKVINGINKILEETDEYDCVLWDALALLNEQQEQIDRLIEENASNAEMAEGLKELLQEQEAVEPKTGHWIWLQFCANEGVYCSECHTKMFDRYPMKKKLSQFCGHCGAKMDDEVKGL